MSVHPLALSKCRCFSFSLLPTRKQCVCGIAARCAAGLFLVCIITKNAAYHAFRRWICRLYFFFRAFPMLCAAFHQLNRFIAAGCASAGDGNRIKRSKSNRINPGQRGAKQTASNRTSQQNRRHDTRPINSAIPAAWLLLKSQPSGCAVTKTVPGEIGKRVAI